MTTKHRGRHDRVISESPLDPKEKDGIIRDLAHIIFTAYNAHQHALLHERKTEAPRGFTERILLPSKTRLAGNRSQNFGVNTIAQMYLVDILCREMRYSEHRRILLATHIAKHLGKTALTEEELADSIRTFLRRYPLPLHVSRSHPDDPREND
jgi:hypothetical protein